MTVSRALASSSGNFPLKKVLVKKFFTTFIAAMALLSATLNTVGDASAVTDFSDHEEQSTPVRLGLNRTRPAFTKAIGMLADAANSNDWLQGYYERVAMRVTGINDDGEASGIVVKPVNNRITRGSTSNVTRPAVQSDTQPETPIELSTASLTATTSATSDKDASTAGEQTNGDNQSAPQQFTVGDMTFETNPAIEHWVNYYATNGRRTMEIGIERSNEYLEMARAEFRNAGVPEDLVWLACVESVWNPRAQSPAAAGGIWQFIPATATEYGLTVERGNDERSDPLKQTRVAAAYLHDLYTIFGDWALAMAAYNSGEPRVMGAIVKNGNANFWELYNKQLLPQETCDYVPKILATIKLASEAEDYGFVPQSDTTELGGS
ncbi:MAG TPA: lytic transglycosylase domain-containing protein [Blastocatellia bacterium]|nr:lytic transglycosylase domain-containing protein [Blastocatellia bacterium]